MQLTAQLAEMSKIMHHNGSASDLVTRLTSERDEAQALCLISKQILEDTRQQGDQTVRELEMEISALKEKLDKTEFIMQYKEEVWTYLEREIRKVVHKDSDLLKKVQTKTRILTSCLAQNKVSTVVKQNAALVDDHERAVRTMADLV